MKNFKLKAIAIVLALLAIVFVGCNKNKPEETTPEATTPDTSVNNPVDTFDAASLVAGFATEIDTTVVLTYVTNYQVDVVRPGEEGSGGLDSFKRDVVATTVIEMDLGADMYMKITKTRQDKLTEDTATVMEAVLYKKGDSYFYQTSSTETVELTAEEAAEGFVALFEEATYEQIGGLTLDALLYNSLDKAYELALFGLSDTFIEDDLADPTYSAAPNGGLKVNYKPEYIGYRTDGGWSDFSNADAGYAADVEIITNDKGFVTSMKEAYNQASLVFNIMSNPPTVTITGERSFTATYGEEITKVESVTTTPSVAVYESASNGTFVVKTCANGEWGNMTEVENGGSLVMGNFICIKVTPDEGYEVAAVVVNGSEETVIPVASAGGFYCFNVIPGENTIEVTFKAAGATVQAPTAVYSAAEGGTFVVKTCAMGQFQNMADVANGGELTMGNFICVLPTANEGYQLVKVLVNGQETPLLPPAGAGGYYCFNVAEGENKIQVIFAESDKELATATYETAEGGTFVVKTCKMNDFGNMYNVDNNGVLVVGNIICVKPTANDGYTVAKVIVNGSETPMIDPAMAGGFYCFSAASGENTIVVVFEAN